MAATTITETILSFTLQTLPAPVGAVLAFATSDRSTTPLRMRRAFVAAMAGSMFATPAKADAAFAAAQSGDLAAWKAVIA